MALVVGAVVARLHRGVGVLATSSTLRRHPAVLALSLASGLAMLVLLLARVVLAGEKASPQVTRPSGDLAGSLRRP